MVVLQIDFWGHFSGVSTMAFFGLPMHFWAFGLCRVSMRLQENIHMFSLGVQPIHAACGVHVCCPMTSAKVACSVSRNTACDTNLDLQTAYVTESVEGSA